MEKKDQEIISLKILSKLTFSEIAEILGESTNTIKWRYYKSMYTLKILLSNLSMFIVTATLGILSIKNQNKNANELKSQYEDTLKTANADADNIIQEAKTTAKTEYDRIVSDANSQAGKIIENAEKTVVSQREKTLRGLESQIAGLAIDTAAKVIGEQAGSLDNAKLYDEFLNKAGDAHDTDIN